MKNFAKLLTTALMIGCLAAGIAGCGGSHVLKFKFCHIACPPHCAAMRLR